MLMVTETATRLRAELDKSVLRLRTPPLILTVRSFRNAWLSSGGVAVIKVGAATEVEMKEKKLRIEDALAATKAAVEEGIVAGRGTALLNAIPAVEKLVEESQGDEKTGAAIVLKSLEEPSSPDRRKRQAWKALLSLPHNERQ